MHLKYLQNFVTYGRCCCILLLYIVVVVVRVVISYSSCSSYKVKAKDYKNEWDPVDLMNKRTPLTPGTKGKWVLYSQTGKVLYLYCCCCMRILFFFVPSSSVSCSGTHFQ